MAVTGEEVEHASGSFEVATWRIVTLFLVIVAVDTAWEFFDEFVTHRLQTRMHIGLLRAWEQLKFETMALGLISLLLVVGEVRRTHNPATVTVSRSAGSCLTCKWPGPFL